MPKRTNLQQKRFVVAERSGLNRRLHFRFRVVSSASADVSPATAMDEDEVGRRDPDDPSAAWRPVVVRCGHERCGGRSARPQPKAIAKRPRVMGTLGHLGGEAQLVEHFLGKPARADCLFLRIPAWQRKSPRHGTVEADDLVELPQARKSEMDPSNGTTAIWKSRSAKSAGARHRTGWTR